jgi:hypothetical protein
VQDDSGLRMLFDEQGRMRVPVESDAASRTRTLAELYDSGSAEALCDDPDSYSYRCF